MDFGIRDDLVEVAKDPEDGTPVLARNLYIVARAANGRQWAHNHSFLDRTKVACEEFGSVWVNRAHDEADFEARTLLRKIEAAFAEGTKLDPTCWDEIDPAYGSEAYQELDTMYYFRDREIMEAADAGEISPSQASRLMIG